ncbi:MAG TPA: hypothetical protein VKA86_05090 [Candidatus Krumholzibacteria bacterium]|nr:hypothetical protein [Candidatus Krumholzibacteria bacterium]
MPRSRVVAIRTQPETVGEDVARALRLLRTRRAPSTLGTWVIFDTPRTGPGTATPPWTLDAVLSLMVDRAGTDRPRVGSIGWDPERTADEAVARVLARHGLGAETLVPEGEESRRTVPDVDLPWLRGQRAVDPSVDADLAGRDLIRCGALVRDPDLGLRGAVDGALRTVARPDELHRRDPQTMIESMQLHDAVFAGTVHLLDATVCGARDPGRPPVVHDLLLAGSDPVTLDAVAARVLGYDPERIPWLRGLAEATRRELTPGSIEVTGGGLDLSATAGTTPHGGRALAIRRGTGRAAAEWLRRFDPARWLGRLRRRGWIRTYERTPWGRLDEDYRRAGRPRIGGA